VIVTNSFFFFLYFKNSIWSLNYNNNKYVLRRESNKDLHNCTCNSRHRRKKSHKCSDDDYDCHHPQLTFPDPTTRGPYGLTPTSTAGISQSSPPPSTPPDNGTNLPPSPPPPLLLSQPPLSLPPPAVPAITRAPPPNNPPSSAVLVTRGPVHA
jgi:hypothetical protein